MPHRHTRKVKDLVLGLVERGGRLGLVPIADTKSRILQPELEKNISEHVGTIFTDDHPIYGFALKGKFAGKHKTINHSNTYGIGSTHTNTIETAFRLFQHGLYGTLHKISKKHLGRYCNEFSYRFNRRKQHEHLFAEAMMNFVNGERLSYKKPTASAKVSQS